MPPPSGTFTLRWLPGNRPQGLISCRTRGSGSGLAGTEATAEGLLHIHPMFGRDNNLFK